MNLVDYILGIVGYFLYIATPIFQDYYFLIVLLLLIAFYFLWMFGKKQGNSFKSSLKNSFMVTTLLLVFIPFLSRMIYGKFEPIILDEFTPLYSIPISLLIGSMVFYVSYILKRKKT